MGISKQMLLEEMEAERICRNCRFWNYNPDALDEDPGMRDSAVSGYCSRCHELTSATGNCSGTKNGSDDFEFC